MPQAIAGTHASSSKGNASGDAGPGAGKPVGKEPGDRSEVTSTGSSATGTHGGSSHQNAPGHSGGTGDELTPRDVLAEATRAGSDQNQG
ncbi:MAG TPA: hypothetical protein VD948_07870 [Rhodothermales bacterium]|nr:hypothetical protein [Rhodothermales bacterium]